MMSLHRWESLRQWFCGNTLLLGITFFDTAVRHDAGSQRRGYSQGRSCLGFVTSPDLSKNAVDTHLQYKNKSGVTPFSASGKIPTWLVAKALDLSSFLLRTRWWFCRCKDLGRPRSCHLHALGRPLSVRHRSSCAKPGLWRLQSTGLHEGMGRKQLAGGLPHRHCQYVTASATSFPSWPCVN